MTLQEMHHLWNLLSQSWGDRFSQQFGASPNDAWRAALAGVGIQAAQHAYRVLVKSSPEFPPTLPQFIEAASEYRSAASSVPRIGATGHGKSNEDLRADASESVALFGRYREYETWRSTNSRKGQKPPHPTPGSPDWLYLQRLAWIEAAAHNASIGKSHEWAA